MFGIGVLFDIMIHAVDLQCKFQPGRRSLLGTVHTLPYLLDHLLVRRLGIVGQLLLFPLTMVAVEFAMGVFSPLGTAYGLLAVTQYANLPLLQIISVTGPYGIGFLIGWFATTANWAWEKPGVWRREPAVVGAFAVVMMTVLVGGALRLAFFPPSTSYVRIAGIVPSMDVLRTSNRMLGYDLQGGTHPPSKAELDRIDPVRLRPAFDVVHAELFANTRRAAQAGAKIVVWSENAAVVRDEDVPALLAEAAVVARGEHIYLEVADNIPFVRDETHLVGPDGSVLWTYRKAYPILGLEVYAPGNRKAPVVSTPYGRIANVICYDADFPGLLVGTDADIMLVPGGDWPKMGRVHTLRMASLRAIENGFALLRQDSNGVSAAFDYQGHVLALQDTTSDDRHPFIADVPARGVGTIYRAIGDTFAWLCVAGSMLFVALGSFRRRRSSAAE